MALAIYTGSGLQSTQTVKIATLGSGDTLLKGQTQTLIVKMVGSGDMKLSGLKSQNADISNNGSGDITLYATQKLKIEATGSGDIKYRGKPSIQSNLTGSGNLQSINLPSANLPSVSGQTAQTILTFDIAALDTLDALGIEVTGISYPEMSQPEMSHQGKSQPELPVHLSKYAKKPYVNIGSATQPNLKTIKQLQPDLIFISKASNKHYKALNQIAPTIHLISDDKPIIASFQKRIKQLAKRFGKEDEVQSHFDQITKHLTSMQLARQLYQDRLLVVKLDNGQMRISNEMDTFVGKRLQQGEVHGQKISKKQLLKINPTWLIVLIDNPTAKKRAKALLKRYGIEQTKAFKRSNIFYFNHALGLGSAKQFQNQLGKNLNAYWGIRDRMMGHAKWHNNPEDLQVIWENSDAFWKAVDASKKADGTYDEVIFQKTYLAHRTEFLDAYSRSWSGNNDWAYQTYDLIPFYQSYRSFMNRRDGLGRKQLVTYMKRLRSYYPSAKFPNVYMSVGKMRQGGTAIAKGIFIGVEMFPKGANPDLSKYPQFKKYESFLKGVQEQSRDDIPKVVVHEIMHFQQIFTGALERILSRTTRDLLDSSLIEGAAEFLSFVVMEGESFLVQSSSETFRYFKDHEAKLWQAFKKDRQEQKWGNWLYNARTSTDRPSDLGYYIGFHIAKAYWDNMEDKQQAFFDILNWSDADEFLKKSGYDELHR